MWIMQDALPRIKTFLKPAGFNRNVFGMVVRVISAFVLHSGRMSASAAASSIRTAARHRASLARFLARSDLGNSSDTYLRVVHSCVRLEKRVRGTWVFIVDKTNVTHQGSKTPNTYSTGNRQRRPRRGRRYSKQKRHARRCHGFAAGLLITPSGYRIPLHHCYYTQEYAKETGRTHKTEAELAAWLIGRLPVPADAEVVVLGDTAYDAQCVRDACDARGFTWIVPVNPERVVAGSKPRPKLRSLISQFSAEAWTRLRLKPAQGKYAQMRRLSLHRMGPKLNTRTYYVHRERLQVHSVGKVQVVFSTKENPRSGPVAADKWKILMTNNLRLSVREIVELYELRWQIELFFKELKSTCGMHQYQFRKFAAVESWMELCLLAFLYLEWIRATQERQRGSPPKARRRWRSLRTYGLCLAVRQQAQDRELRYLAKSTHTPGGLKQLKKLLRAAYPLEYRIAA